MGADLLRFDPVIRHPNKRTLIVVILRQSQSCVGAMIAGCPEVLPTSIQ
jgi:hypothetical protein